MADDVRADRSNFLGGLRSLVWIGLFDEERKVLVYIGRVCRLDVSWSFGSWLVVVIVAVLWASLNWGIDLWLVLMPTVRRVFCFRRSPSFLTHIILTCTDLVAAVGVARLGTNLYVADYDCPTFHDRPDRAVPLRS